MALIVTPRGSNYRCLEQIFMVPKGFEPSKFDCMLTWKYSDGCLVVCFGDLILGFLARDGSAEGGGVVGFWMMGDGVICAVFGELGSMMVVGAVFCSVWWWCLPLRHSRLSVCWRRRSDRRQWWSSSSCGLGMPLASSGCRLPPVFSPLLVYW